MKRVSRNIGNIPHLQSITGYRLEKVSHNGWIKASDRWSFRKVENVDAGPSRGQRVARFDTTDFFFGQHE
jgi:hypothetical protein